MAHTQRLQGLGNFNGGEEDAVGVAIVLHPGALPIHTHYELPVLGLIVKLQRGKVKGNGFLGHGGKGTTLVV
jgi:hypothetical protein